MNRDEKLRMLAEELDGLPEEVYDDLLLKLAESAREHHAGLVAALGSGAHDEAARLAHAIKGGAANLRVQGLRAAAEAIETDLRSGRPLRSDAVDRLESALEELENELETS